VILFLFLAHLRQGLAVSASAQRERSRTLRIKTTNPLGRLRHSSNALAAVSWAQTLHHGSVCRSSLRLLWRIQHCAYRGRDETTIEQGQSAQSSSRAWSAFDSISHGRVSLGRGLGLSRSPRLSLRNFLKLSNLFLLGNADSVLLAPSQALPEHFQDTVKFPRNGGLAGIPESTASLAAATSPRSHTPVARSGIGGIIERVVDPKSATYGHHRQTSIVHGIQHSRNGSLASSSSSPLSPQMIAAAGVGLFPDRSDLAGLNRPDTEMSVLPRPQTALGGSTTSPSFPPLERNATADGIGGTVTQRKLERMHSKSRRDHAHHHSHSSKSHSEQKTVGEYALHVLFTHVGSQSLSLAEIV
jgi:hypothetical protein